MTAVIDSPAALAEFVSDTAAVSAAAEAGTLRDTLKAAAKAISDRDKTIEEQIAIGLQQQMAALAKETGGAGAPPIDLTEAKKGMRSRVTKHDIVNHGQKLTVREHHNPRALGKPADGVFGDLVEYLQATAPDKVTNSLPDVAELRQKLGDVLRIQNAYGSQVPADGGYLIPEEFRSDLLSVSMESAIVRPRATVLPMSTLRAILPSIDSTTNAGSIFGGIVAYWTEEAAALTASQASFARVVLEAKKLTAYAEYPNELVADAALFGALIDQLMPQAIAWYEDLAFFSGSGVGEPLGFLNCPASVNVAKESGQAGVSIVWENIAKMYARMLPSSLGNAVWIAGIDTFPELATMALSVGTGGSAIWMNNGAEGPPMTILGRPVIFTEKSSVLGTVGDINFVDLRYYLIGDRQSMQAASSAEYKFGNDMTAYRIIERLDGRPWLNSAITPKNSGPTLTPFVQLATRA